MSLPAGFHIRPVASGEAALLRAIMLRCWTGTVAANSSAFRETEDDIARQLAAGGAMFLIRDEEPVGSGRWHPVPGPAGDARSWVEIKRVGVLKELRTGGLGAPLVAALEADARARGYAGAQLGVRQDVPRLVRFWERLGYAIAPDVTLHTVNPLTPPPFTMRKVF